MSLRNQRQPLHIQQKEMMVQNSTVHAFMGNRKKSWMQNPPASASGDTSSISTRARVVSTSEDTPSSTSAPHLQPSVSAPVPIDKPSSSGMSQSCLSTAASMDISSPICTFQGQSNVSTPVNISSPVRSPRQTVSMPATTGDGLLSGNIQFPVSDVMNSSVVPTSVPPQNTQIPPPAVSNPSPVMPVTPISQLPMQPFIFDQSHRVSHPHSPVSAVRRSLPITVSQQPSIPSLSQVFSVDAPSQIQGQQDQSTHRNKRQRVNQTPAYDSASGYRVPRPAYRQLSTKIFLQDLSRLLHPTSSVELARYDKIEQACFGDDLFYLLLQELYCLYSKTSQLQINGFGLQQVRGLNVIAQFILGNETLSKPFLEACSRFPLDLLRLDTYEFSVHVTTVFRHVLYFLGTLGIRWEPFEKKVLQRGYPPLAEELVANFPTHSYLLIHVIFLYLLRKICSSSIGNFDAWIKQHEEILKKNWQYFVARVTRGTLSAAQKRQEEQEKKMVYDAFMRLKAVRLRQFSESLPIGHPVLPSMPGPRHQPIQQNIPQSGPYQQFQRQSFPTQPHIYTTYNQQTVPVTTQPGVPGINGNSVRYSPATARPNNMLNGAVTQSVLLSYGSQYSRASSQGQANGVSSQDPGYFLVFPRDGPSTSAVVDPDPDYVGIHTCYLKDHFKILGKSGKPGDSQLFQYLHSFEITPQPIDIRLCEIVWNFTVTSDDAGRLPIKVQSQGDFPVSGYQSGTMLYQLRCTKIPGNIHGIPEYKWTTYDTVWPESIYIHVNQQEYFLRRRLHYGRDMPVNITSSVKEGVNEIKISMLPPMMTIERGSFAIALERIECVSRDRARASVRNLSVAASVDAIKRRLTGTLCFDDELTVVDDHFAIDLVDPYMGRIFDTPARSTCCSHRECFDLDTFLDTRLAQARKKGGMAESWKCPICSVDARPVSLMIDGFLVMVRACLEERHQLDVRAILVRKDGSWVPKTDKLDAADVGGSNGDSNGEVFLPVKNEPNSPQSGIPNRTSSAARKSGPEVVELD